MTPIMLLHKPTGVGSVGRSELVHRADMFARGCWQELIHQARQSIAARPVERQFTEEEDRQRRGKAAQNRVQQGQVSRARQELTGASLAPRNSATLDELRRKRPQTRQAEIPLAVLQYEPARGLKFDAKLFASCFRSAPLGSSPGLGGCSYEILRVCLDDQECLLLLTDAAQDFARGSVPDEIFRPFMLATMTALKKKDGGVRGIATGTAFRRLVAKTLARQFGKDVEEARSPFKFALSTRAGVDCVGHTVRAVTDADHLSTVMSVDGIGAYDHVFRASMSL